MIRVSDSLENRNGDTGWDFDYYGPFATTREAEDFARDLAKEGYSENDGERRLICVEGGEGRPFRWRSDSEPADENRVYAPGPLASDSAKARLLLAIKDDENG